ncbi:PREDICTED: alkaline phosphatase 4 isoform X1 [Rhagoletis zephyria]|uniref:alkaline phosphatase 4 isoform X1 n=1 Tax=Rhagoletis zephyria TaxID=28612 RepID=UPI0008114D44|nr:PREDICTED: alkaline phosphatase 4 isoform X1 [Rhagoletis zephyria]
MEQSKSSPPISHLRLNTTRIFAFATTILLTMIITMFCVSIMMRYEVDSEVSSIEDTPYWKDDIPPEQKLWFDEAIEELEVALNKNWRKQLARNAIIFVISGIDTETMAAAREVLSNRSKPQRKLIWERFPHLGRLKNSCSNTDLCDPFTVASALFNGVRPNFRVGGFDSSVHFRDCRASANISHYVKSILEQAQENGMRTGFITTRRVTGAAMGALYAHTPNTAWECDAALPVAARAAGCIDTALQLIKSEVGRQVNVIMGGGRQTLVSHSPNTAWDPVDETVCDSRDNRNIISDWQKLNVKLKREFAVLQNKQDLQELNGTNVDHVMGIFANNYLPLLMDGLKAPKKRTPQLSEMMGKALEVLKRKDKGYFLIVESGIKSSANVAEQIRTLLHWNDVVQQIVEQNSEDETLILSVFTNGYYVRNAVDGSAEVDVIPKEMDFPNENEAAANDRLVNMPTEAVVYARGPRSHLLHGVHEETYMSYVLSYALQMGHFSRKLNTEEKRNI